MKKVLILIVGILLGILFAEAMAMTFISKKEYDYIENKENMIHDIENANLIYEGREIENRPVITDFKINYMIRDRVIDFMVYFHSDEAWDVSMFNSSEEDGFIYRKRAIERKAKFSLPIDKLKEAKKITFGFTYRGFDEIVGEDQVRYFGYLDDTICDEILKNAEQ